MNHSTVAHRWANDNYTSKGTLTGPRMFAEQSTRTIYSHGHHFCIARKTDCPEFPVLFTYRGFSPSTSKHIGEVRNALSSHSWGLRFECHNPADSVPSILHTEWSALKMDKLPALVTATRDVAAMQARIAARSAKGLPESATLAERLETLQSRVASLQVEIRDRATQLDRFSKAFAVNLKRDCPATYPIAKSFLSSPDLMTLSATLEKQAAKAAAKLAKARKLEAEKQAEENRERWEAWKTDSTIYGGGFYDLPTALRVKGDLVETSRGASVPVKHAVRLFVLATACRDAGKAWSSPPEKSFAVGHYTLTSIDSAGNVVIGCHELDFAEMERVAPAAREAYAAQPVTVD